MGSALKSLVWSWALTRSLPLVLPCGLHSVQSPPNTPSAQVVRRCFLGCRLTRPPPKGGTPNPEVLHLTDVQLSEMRARQHRNASRDAGIAYMLKVKAGMSCQGRFAASTNLIMKPKPKSRADRGIAKPSAAPDGRGAPSIVGIEASLRSPEMADLNQRAEAALKGRPAPKQNKPDPRRLLHEMQVHHVELEMQNSTLQEAQATIELFLEHYTDLYEFAPVAYFTVDSVGSVRQANLAGARMVGRDRADLIGQPLTRSLVPGMRARFNAFLKATFDCEARQTAEFDLLGPTALQRSVSIDAQCTLERTQCRLVATDITERKQAEQTRIRLEVLASTNRELELEIVHRRQVEQSLLVSQRRQRKHLVETKRLHDELRRLTHLNFETLEEERRRISRELHDQITQTLVSISFQLASLANDKQIKPHMLRRRMLRTKKLVAESVEIVHAFARDLRPPALDHLGLIPALNALMTDFLDRTEIKARLTALPEVEKLSSGRRIAIYRVVQSALSNVKRHSGAKNVVIEIQREARFFLLTVADDGKSFDASLLRYGKADRRLGLLGMRERVEMVGGSFEIQCKPGKGTTVQARIPISGGTREPIKRSRVSPP